jgi:hypothetical protein
MEEPPYGILRLKLSLNGEASSLCDNFAAGICRANPF